MNPPNLPGQGKDPEIREQRSGGWCSTLIGLPFFLIGALLVSYAAGFNPLQIENRGVPVLMLWIVGLPFAVIGFWVAFGNSHTRIDRKQATLSLSSGILFFAKRTKLPLQVIQRIQFDYIPGDSERTQSFMVRLRLQEPHGPVVYYSGSRYALALAVAKDLCYFLNIPLEDLSGGPANVYPPAYLNENLGDRLRRLGEEPHTLPPRPAQMRTSIQETWDGVILEIPSPWDGITKIAPLVNSRLANTRVTATSALLRIEGRASTGEHSVVQNNVHLEIPVAALWNLNLTTMRSIAEKNTPPKARKDQGRVSELALSIATHLGSPGITAQSEKEFVQFGIGLPEEEAAYLYALLKSVLLK